VRTGRISLQCRGDVLAEKRHQLVYGLEVCRVAAGHVLHTSGHRASSRIGVESQVDDEDPPRPTLMVENGIAFSRCCHMRPLPRESTRRRELRHERTVSVS
jgi:hypothetical protein